VLINIIRLPILVLLTLVSFAGNSLLCRLALRTNSIDPGFFTLLRVLSGVIVLSLIMAIRYRKFEMGGTWKSGIALFVYAIGFSWAYVHLSAATGALILFGCVQVTMILSGYLKGERLNTLQIFGFLTAISGFIFLLFPGISAPAPLSAALMALAGFAWGVYSLIGRTSSVPIIDTAGNFMRALPFCLVIGLVHFGSWHSTGDGILLAIISGAITSGLGYAIWYQVLPNLSASTAAIIQLSVPMIATAGGFILLDEDFNLRIALSSVLILVGIGLVLVKKIKMMRS
jgi:drug/metabolite transporter (DMT)-like permease